MENKSAFTDAEREAERLRRQKQNEVDLRERRLLNKDELQKNKLSLFFWILPPFFSFIFIWLLLFSFVFTAPDLENSSEAVVIETSTQWGGGRRQRLTLEKQDGSQYHITTNYYHGIQPGDTISIIRHRRVTRYVGDYTHRRWTFDRIGLSAILAMGSVAVLFVMIPVSVTRIARKFKNKR